ncbi:MAG: hypothetical protein V8T87_15040 [Victivallales bacterium]
MSFLLLLVVAVFINVPATIFNILTPGHALFWPAVAAIFLYYIAATLFPVDKIIGTVYPLFGALLIIGSFALSPDAPETQPATPRCCPESAAFRANMLTPANNRNRSCRCCSSRSPAASSPASTPRSRRSSPARWSMERNGRRTITA